MLLIVLAFSVFAATNLIQNPGFDTDWSNWTNDGCSRSNTQCSSYMAVCDVGENFYQWITPTQSGVHRVRWMFYGDPIASHYGSLYDKNSEGMGCSWNYTPVNCNFGTWHYFGLNAGDPYKLRFTHPSYGARTDDVTLEYYRDYITHTYDVHNVILNPGFYGGLQEWTEATGDPDYDGDAGADDFGCLDLDATQVLTQIVEVNYTATYTFGMTSWCGALGYVRMYIYQGGSPLDYVAAGPCGGTGEVSVSDQVNLTAGEAEIRLIAYTDSRAVDDVYLWNGQEVIGEDPDPPPPEWDADGWLYYPYLLEDGTGEYQTYTPTTWYGDDYNYWNVWRVRPGAYAYPIATLDIMEVGVNSFGYFIDARINSWPDVISTTVRYEGLSSVLVSPGQRVGPNCELGLVGPNYQLSAYHLMLYTEFADSPINPVPYMSKYPVRGMCVPIDPDTQDTVGPGAGEVASQLTEVCQACSVPSTWTNIGRWISWLGCMVQNLFMCYLINWINGVITMLAIFMANFQVRMNDLEGTMTLFLGRVVDMGDWAAAPLNGGLDWLDAAITDGLIYLTGSFDDFGARLDNLGYIVMSYAGGSTTYITEEAGTNFFDYLVERIRLQLGILDMITALLVGFFNLMVTALGMVADMVQLVLMLVGGLLSGLFGADGSGSTDLIASVLEVDNLVCTQAGAFATSGDSLDKAGCMIVIMLAIFDQTVATTALRYIVPVAIGVIVMVLAIFVLSQSDKLLPA